MKKIILITAVLLISSQLFAQIPGLSLGPKVGATFSKYSLDIDDIDIEDIKTETKNSFHWGAFVRFGNKVYIQPELLFMNRSGVIINPSLSSSEQTIKLRTIDIPLLLGVKIMDYELTNLRIFGGPVATIAINREIETRNWDEAIVEDDIRRANWGLQFGAGVDFLMFTADLRYELGMGNYHKVDLYELKNSLITVSLGWKILQ